MAKKSAKVDLAKVDRKQLEDVIQQRSKVRVVPVSDIYPNPWNKNRMGGDYFAALKANIANPKIGFTQPILVRPHPVNEGKWEIVDGEHRWKASKDIGMENVPVIVLQDLTDAMLKYIMLESNAIRGHTDDSDIKNMIREIENDSEWMREMENFDPWSALVTEEPVDDSSKYAIGDDYGDTTRDVVPVTLYLSPEHNAIYKKVVGQLRLAHGYTAEQAVIDCIQHFSTTTGFGEIPDEEGNVQTMPEKAKKGKGKKKDLEEAPGLED